MQTRAVEFAQKHNIPFEVRSTFSNKTGTTVKKKVKSLEDTLVSGVAIDKNQVRLSITELADRPGAAAAIFKVMSEAGVVVELRLFKMLHVMERQILPLQFLLKMLFVLKSLKRTL